MTLATDDILPEQSNGEVVHWMEPAPLRVGPAGLSMTAATAFALGIAAALGGLMLFRYLAPRREGLPPWRWRRGSVH